MIKGADVPQFIVSYISFLLRASIQVYTAPHNKMQIS